MSEKVHDDYSQIFRYKIEHLTVLEQRLMDVLNMFEAMCDIIEPQSALDNDLNMLILNTHAVLTNISNQQLRIIELLQRNREKMIGSNSKQLLGREQRKDT